MTFNHNDHYHRFLLRHVPPNCRRALDVGCGTGTFARLLATRVAQVDAIDQSADMIFAARAHHTPSVSYLTADIRQVEFGAGTYDFISCIASIHHMPFAPTITQLRHALAPDGILAILGLSRPTLADHLLGSLAVAPNRVRLAAARRRPTSGPHLSPPVKHPDMTLTEIRRAAADLLPGATIRRHLYFRYSLIYRAQ
jgi:SAM-dependent methyltransferase